MYVGKPFGPARRPGRPARPALRRATTPARSLAPLPPMAAREIELAELEKLARRLTLARVRGGKGGKP